MEKKKIYTRWCDRCVKLFETADKYGKVCTECDLRYKRNAGNIKSTNNNTHGQSPIIPDGQSKTKRVGRLVSGQRSTESRVVTHETPRGSQSVQDTSEEQDD